jgi:hypothetical protein
MRLQRLHTRHKTRFIHTATHYFPLECCWACMWAAKTEVGNYILQCTLVNPPQFVLTFFGGLMKLVIHTVVETVKIQKDNRTSNLGSRSRFWESWCASRISQSALRFNTSPTVLLAIWKLHFFEKCSEICSCVDLLFFSLKAHISFFWVIVNSHLLRFTDVAILQLAD